MKKILVIAGQTGLGKTNLAFNLATKLKTDVIIGDALQVYKNWPILTNFPNASFQEKVKYRLLGSLDAFKNRITTVDYRNMVCQEIKLVHEKHDLAIIEGGSCFYLNYLLNACDEQYPQVDLDESERKIDQFNKNISLVQTLKNLCPSYDNSIDPQDEYRIKKAIKFAILTQGQKFKLDNFATQGTLRTTYDIRGIFLYTNTTTLTDIVNQRCDNMFQNGMINEILQSLLGKDQKMQVDPIGLQQAIRLLISIKKHSESFDYRSRKEKEDCLNQLILNFVGDFQVKTRQYATYQRKYFRNKMDDFIWCDSNDSIDLQSLINIPKEEYIKLVKSDINIQKRNSTEDIKINKSLAPQPLNFSRQQFLQDMKFLLIPKLKQIKLESLQKYIK